MSVKKRATPGKERRKYLRYVRVQLGSVGWSTAQLVCLISGWAEAVRGLIFESDGGRVSLPGKRIGEMKAGHFSLLKPASASTISKVAGQGLLIG
jgi:hypothetical protein